MRLLRSAVTIALATLPLVAIATPANAVVCPLLVDPAGDGSLSLAPTVSSNQLDIRSGDVASGPTTVVAVLRVASLADTLLSQGGVSWSFGWTINGDGYAVVMRRSAGPNPLYTAMFQSQAGTIGVPYSFDLGTGEITWRVPRSALPVLATPGQVFHEFRGFTTAVGISADVAFAATSSYVDQDPGCVPAS